MDGIHTAKGDKSAIECIKMILKKIKPGIFQKRAPWPAEVNQCLDKETIHTPRRRNLRSLQEGANTKYSDMDRSEVENIVEEGLLSFKKAKVQ